MPEREAQTSERVNLDERGGLTPAHWQHVINRIGWRKGEISAKIVNYGQKVISGEFPDAGYHHGRFLGQRHWKEIANLQTKNREMRNLRDGPQKS